MASNINENNIDPEFPVAGQDNDSQGFRDNFEATQNNFGKAKEEIEDLQNSTAKVNKGNDFNQNEIKNATFVANTGRVINKGTVDGSTESEILNLSFKESSYYILNIDDNVTFTLTEWPEESKFASMRILLRTSDDTAKTVTWSGQPSPVFRKGPNWPDTGNSSQTAETIVNNPDKTIVIDFWTDDGGLVIYANYLGEFS